MRKLYVKIFVASLPLLIIVAVYFINDPFQVLRKKERFFPVDGVQYVSVNKDYASTEMFLMNYPQYHYDSYIFGSSRSMYYHVAEWQRHIHSDRIFHFDAYGESLYGIERKFQLLKRMKVPVKNALLILSADDGLDMVEDNEFTARKHPAITGQSAFIFQIKCFSDYMDPGFLKQYFRLLLTGTVQVRPFDNTLNILPTHYEAKWNEVTFPLVDEDIARNRDSFYSARSHFFYDRDTAETWEPQHIFEKQKRLFQNIHDILKENNTAYKVVISPLYCQRRMHKEDLAYLQQLFGAAHVYDFSGRNKFTASKYNYYEDSHYKPFIATAIMDSIYQN